MTDRSAKVHLSLAICEYDHVRDFMTGQVTAEGLEINFQTFPIQEIFHRFTRHREWDVSEMSMGMYVSLLSQGDDSLTAIPVFLSRMFRQSSFYVRRGGPVAVPTDLRGRRVGYPDWSHTAGIYARGYLMHELKIGLDEIEWVQAGVDEPGRVEHLAFVLPPGVRRSSRPERSLDQMLRAGEVDAVLSSHAPRSFTAGDPEIVRLFPGFMREEADYYRRTGVFPIMHLIAIRREIHDAYPWAAMNLFKAFEEAKSRSLQRMMDGTVSRYPFPWTFALAAEARALFGADFWPYGIEPNRTTIEAFLRFCHEQGVAHRPVALDELFPPQLSTFFKV